MDWSSSSPGEAARYAVWRGEAVRLLRYYQVLHRRERQSDDENG